MIQNNYLMYKDDILSFFIMYKVLFLTSMPKCQKGYTWVTHLKWTYHIMTQNYFILNDIRQTKQIIWLFINIIETQIHVRVRYLI